jgi:hypothetical protein
MDALAHAILETAQAWEGEGLAAGKIGPIIGAVDETFLQVRPVGRKEAGTSG